MTRVRMGFDRAQLFNNDRYSLFKTFAEVYNKMVKIDENNRSELVEEMLADLDVNTGKFATLNSIVQKY